jgi:hypothetical protein
MTLATIRAFFYGIPDGWNQPYYLNTSRNVDHLFSGSDDVYGALDAGINVGQLLRAGSNSQAWQEGYWPVSWNGRAAA